MLFVIPFLILNLTVLAQCGISSSEVKIEVVPPSNTNEISFPQSPDPADDTATATVKTLKPSDITGDLESWEAPEYLSKYFPYYHSGYDDDGRPVWIAEAGKFPLREFAELDKKAMEDLEKYMRQGSYRIRSSIREQNRADQEVNDAFFILDYEGFELSQIVNPKVALFVIRLLRLYLDVIVTDVGVCLLINVNYAAGMLINIVRPVVGKAMEKIEIYGTNSAKWKAVLRRRLPIQAIPPWYGGKVDFKPLQVYG